MTIAFQCKTLYCKLEIEISEYLLRVLKSIFYGRCKLFIFFATWLLSSSSAVEVEQLPIQKIWIGSKSIEVEVADELHERQRGLMYRKTMDIDHGMLFVYPEAEPRSFWMKNTYIPLSIAYIGSDCKIVHIANMIPLTTKGVPSIHPAQFVLEMNQGWFEGNRVKIGDTLYGVQHCLEPQKD